MNVKGEHTFQIAPSELWTYLMDPKVLEQITPGDTSLDNIADDQYKATSNIKIGPVKGTFEGDLAVEDKQEPESFTINMKQKSKIGNAQGKIAMILEEVDAGATKLSFDGKVKLSGMIARTGQRVLSGVANAITQEVFAALEGHIAAQKAASTQSSVGPAPKAKMSIWAIIVRFFKSLFGKN